jgi:succinoglycan biosynthesis transport protein ExoP
MSRWRSRTLRFPIRTVGREYMDHSNLPPHTPAALSPPNGLPTNGTPARVEAIRYPADPVYRAPYISGPRHDFEPEDGDASSSSLLEYWRILRRHKTAILLSAVGCMILGVAIGIPMKPVYRVRTSLEVLNLNEDFMNMKESNPTTTNDNSYETSEEETQAKLLQGDALQNRVMARLDPDHASNTFKPRLATSGWRSWFHLKEHIELTERQKLLSKLALSLKVVPTVRTRVLEVTADSTDPRLAADFLNTLVEQFIQQSVESRLNSTQRTSDWLGREISDARNNLQSAEDALQTYAGQSGLIFTNDDSNVATDKLQQLQAQLSTAIGDRITKQSHFELAKDSPPDSLGDVLKDEALQDTIGKLADARRQVASLSAVFNPSYSKLQQTQAELGVITNTFEKQRADVLKHIEDDYREASNKEKMLAAAYDAQTREVTGQGEKLIQYNILKREVDSSRQLYDTMLQQTKQASIATAMRASNVRVVDPANPPDVPFSPNFKLNAALGLFGGLFLSVVLVTFRERADRTIQQPGDIKLWTDLPELGTIPAATAAKISYGRAAAAVGAGGSGGGSRTAPVRNDAHEMELMSLRHKAGIVAEAFHCTLTSIMFVGENGSRPRVLVVTSANIGEGKTCMVSNLALATAEIRSKVLIIDADLRRPRMHDIYDVPNQRGLSDILREELSYENLAGLVHQTRVPGLHVLPAGPPTQAAAHLLYSPNLAALLARFRSEYEMILIDAPPMLQMTDARVAGRLADGVILVTRAGKTTRDALLAARDRFIEDRIHVLGTILNDFNPKKTLSGYYGYGGSYSPY